MADVKAYDRYGEPITLPAADVPELEKMGGRVATKEDLRAANEGTLSTLASGAGAFLGAITAPIAPGLALVKGATRGVIAAVAPEAAARAAKAESDARERGDMGIAFSDSMDAVGQGYSQGLTAGLGAGVTRQALEAVSPEAGKAYEQWDTATRGAHPYLAKGAELVGMIGSTLATGGATGAARMAPAALIGRAGLAAESLAVRGTAGFGTGVLARAVQTGAKYGAQGAAEGALQGATGYVGEAMLHDHELAAEKLYAAAGHGALWGGALGAAGGAGASLLKSGATAAAGGLSRVLKGAEFGLEGGAAKAVNEHAGRQAVDALGADASTLKRVESRYSGTKADLGNALMDEGVIVGKARADETLGLILAKKNEVGARIGEIVASKEPVKLLPIYEELGNIRKTFESSVVGREALTGFDRTWDSVDSILREGGKMSGGNVAVADIVTARRQIDDLIFQGRGSQLTETQKALKDMRNVLETHAIDALEVEANRAGGTIREELMTLKQRYRTLKSGEELAQKGADRISGNRASSITDYIEGGIGAGVGATVGGMVLGAPGAAVGGALGRVVGAAGNKLVRERGNATAAVFLRRLSDSTEVANVLRRVDTAIDGAAKGLLAPAPAAAPVKRSKLLPAATEATSSPRERAKPHVERVTSSQADPVAYAERVAKDIAPLSSWAPNVAGQYATKATSAAAFLATKLPQPMSRDVMTGQKPTMTDADAHKFLRYQRAVDDPMSVFADMKRGVITPEGVESLKATQPRLYQELRARTLDALADQMVAGKPIPYNRRIALSILLDIPGDRSMVPAYMQSLQANVESLPGPNEGGGAGGGGGGGNAPKRPMNISQPQSQLDRIESGQKA